MNFLGKHLAALAILLGSLLATQNYLLSVHDAHHLGDVLSGHQQSLQTENCSICTALHAPVSSPTMAPVIVAAAAPELIEPVLVLTPASDPLAYSPGARAPPLAA